MFKRRKSFVIWVRKYLSSHRLILVLKKRWKYMKHPKTVFFYEKLDRSMSQTFELLQKNTKMP